MEEYKPGMCKCPIINSEGFCGHKESQPEKKNVANKTPLFNDFLELKFQEDIQARILQAKAILKFCHRQ